MTNVQGSRRWLDQNQTTLELTISSTWSQNSLLIEQPLLEAARSQLSLIINLPRTMSIPLSGFHQQMRQMVYQHEEYDIQPIVFVTRIAYTITLLEESISVLAKTPSRYFFVPTHEDALHLLEG